MKQLRRLIIISSMLLSLTLLSYAATTEVNSPKLDLVTAGLEVADITSEVYAIYQLDLDDSNSCKASAASSAVIHLLKIGNQLWKLATKLPVLAEANRINTNYYSQLAKLISLHTTKDELQAFTQKYTQENHDKISEVNKACIQNAKADYSIITDLYFAYREIHRFIKAEQNIKRSMHKKKLKKIQRNLYIKLCISSLLILPYYTLPRKQNSMMNILISSLALVGDMCRFFWKRERQSYELVRNKNKPVVDTGTLKKNKKYKKRKRL